MWMYRDITPIGNEWVECELLHEFLESYQIRYYSKFVDREVEQVVSRDRIREISNEQRMES